MKITEDVFLKFNPQDIRRFAHRTEIASVFEAWNFIKEKQREAQLSWPECCLSEPIDCNMVIVGDDDRAVEFVFILNAREIKGTTDDMRTFSTGLYGDTGFLRKSPQLVEVFRYELVD